ncbi:MAG: molybdenum cofactor biosynthesis protein MoaE [Microthrixaceae bacterium]|nr:molybdenum cofactor biosynthesis protein MoaE [Microthrixaceae bacterium]
MSVGSSSWLSPPAGRDWIACSPSDLDAGAAGAWVVLPSCGAAVTFTGTVRDHAGTRTGIEMLEYEAYEEYVVPALERVANQVRQVVPDLGRVVLWHRTGELAVTDVAVVVAVSSPHRDEAFTAARWAIDELKATTPIWKREHWPGGAEWVRCDHGHTIASPERVDLESVTVGSMESTTA